MFERLLGIGLCVMRRHRMGVLVNISNIQHSDFRIEKWHLKKFVSRVDVASKQFECPRGKSYREKSQLF